jgi:hypothetical protein
MGCYSDISSMTLTVSEIYCKKHPVCLKAVITPLLEHYRNICAQYAWSATLKKMILFKDSTMTVYDWRMLSDEYNVQYAEGFNYPEIIEDKSAILIKSMILNQFHGYNHARRKNENEIFVEDSFLDICWNPIGNYYQWPSIISVIKYQMSLTDESVIEERLKSLKLDEEVEKPADESNSTDDEADKEADKADV